MSTLSKKQGERWGLRGPRPCAREMISLDPHLVNIA